MPWKVADVDKHKKGLSPSQKKEWVKVANSVYNDCIKKGGTDKTCAPKAIRVANSKFSDKGETKMDLRNVPISACNFQDTEAFARSVEDEKNNADILAYSGKPMDHWWFGKLAIDVNGGMYDRKLYPILEDHETSKKVAFSTKPLVEDNSLRHHSVTYVSTPESLQYRELSKQGFPYQASISIRPMVVEELKDDKAMGEVNGYSLKGPASIIRKWEYRETSVTVFGVDKKTRAKALSDKDDVTVVEFMSSDTGTVDIKTEQTKEVKTLTFKEMMEQDPKGYADFMAEAKKQLEGGFTAQITSLSTRLEASEAKNLDYEKRETLRNEREQLALSDTIWSEALKNSAVPEHLHSKVKAMISHIKFMKEGALDVASFKTAVETEIADWVKSGVSTTVMGLGTNQREVEAAETAEKNLQASDQTWINKMLVLAGQSQTAN